MVRLREDIHRADGGEGEAVRDEILAGYNGGQIMDQKALLA